MIKQFLLEMLTDPETGNTLKYDHTNETLTDAASEGEFKILNGVPIILTKSAAPENSVTALHDQHHSAFDYRAHYESDAEYFDYFEQAPSAAAKNERKRAQQAIIKQVDANTKRILDVGCGNAWVAEYFTAKKIQVVSMDIAVKNPTEALKLYPSEYHAALTADVFHLPFAADSFDTIIASEVIEHVYDPVLFIEKLMNVLHPGGKLILATPYNEHIVYHMCVHCNKPTPANAHLHSFNEDSIKKMLPQGTDYCSMRFLNKYMVRLRVYNLLSFLPYSLWRMTDRFFNLVMPKQSVFLIAVKKTKQHVI